MFENDRKELANLIFPDVKLTVSDLEAKYPSRNLPENAMVTRFAPSPTGFLHTGSLFTSLIAWKFAKQSNGVFYIRLEDTDTKREIEGSGESLLKELAKFNIINDEGYYGTHEEGNYGPYKQSDREGLYRVVIKEMIENDLAYPCFCSSEDLAKLREKQEQDKIIPGYYGEFASCRFLSPREAIKKIQNGEPYIIRFKSRGNHNNKEHFSDLIRGELDLAQNDQDIVILKSDGLPTYHFAHLVDDHFMHSTHITRGEEWLSSAPIHIELFRAMGWDAPKYAHLPVIMKLDNGNRRKLSKRKDSEAAVSFFLQEGYPTEGFIEYLLTIANSNYEEWRKENPNASSDEFMLSFNKMSLDGALFDLDKVKFICKELISKMKTVEIVEASTKWAKIYSPELLTLIEENPEMYSQILSIEREQEKPRKDYAKYSDIYPSITFFYDKFYNTYLNEKVLPWNENFSKEDIKLVLETYAKTINLELDQEEWFNTIKELASSLGFAANVKDYKKNKEAYKGHVGDISEMIRIAVSTSKQSPNLYFVLKILGKDKVIERLQKTINTL